MIVQAFVIEAYSSFKILDISNCGIGILVNFVAVLRYFTFFSLCGLRYSDSPLRKTYNNFQVRYLLMILKISM
jgi:hypothetical protein